MWCRSITYLKYEISSIDYGVAMAHRRCRSLVLHLYLPSSHGRSKDSEWTVRPSQITKVREVCADGLRRTVPRRMTDIAVPDVLEIYPLMFIGVVGGNLVSHLSDVNMSRALTVWMFSLVAAGQSSRITDVGRS